ncbi:MAG: serine hydrolase domain-containing protein, partial [Actinomycetota bacterium]|nr:serine hydrolase domain-containing protein [Actinomycetota bacterium]
MPKAGAYAALESRLSGLLHKYDIRTDTNGVRFALASPSRGWNWEWSSPGSIEQYFIASTTKLYVTTLVMQLRSEGLLDLDAPAAAYLDPSVLAGIHVLHGVDSSDSITVRELLSHTSGIADYFEQRRRDGSTQIGDALRRDFAWTFDDVLRITKEELTPKFAPSTPGKALYSDTNYQLLGAVIEAVTGTSYEYALRQRVLLPLGLEDTYPFTVETNDRYDSVAAMLYGTERVAIPKAMASLRADGGIVSTARDGIVFLEAFMTGRLFPVEYLDEMQQQWNSIFPPLEYGMGIMRFALPRYYTLFRKVPAMIGHSGASGAVLFHVPELDLYVSGTVNQIKKRSLSYNLMTRLVMACQDAWRGWRDRPRCIRAFRGLPNNPINPTG